MLCYVWELFSEVVSGCWHGVLLVPLHQVRPTGDARLVRQPRSAAGEAGPARQCVCVLHAWDLPFEVQKSLQLPI